MRELTIQANPLSEQIQHIVQIDRFPDMDLIFRLRHVVKQKFQDHGAAEAAAFNLEVGEAHGQICILNIVDSDESRIFHGFGDAVAFITVRRDADMIGAVFTETLAADVFVAGFPVIAAEPAAFVA